MRTTQRKGDIGTTQAIATFTNAGYDVSIPITESAPYDLIVEKSGKLYRIQVKYSTQIDVDLRRIHSNSEGYKVKKTKKNHYDWLYIYKKTENSFSEYLYKYCLNDRRSIRPNQSNLLSVVL